MPYGKCLNWMLYEQIFYCIFLLNEVVNKFTVDVYSPLETSLQDELRGKRSISFKFDEQLLYCL